MHVQYAFAFCVPANFSSAGRFFYHSPSSQLAQYQPPLQLQRSSLGCRPDHEPGISMRLVRLTVTHEGGHA